MMAKTVWVKESDLMMYKLFNKYIHKIFAGVHIHNVDVEEKNFPKELKIFNLNLK